MSKNLEACDLREANDTSRKGLVEFLRDQIADNFLARTIDCAIFVKYTNLVFVRSDKFGKITAVGSGSGMTGQMPGFIGVINAVPQWVLNTAGCAVKTRYPNVPHTNVKSTADEHEFR